MLLKKRNFGEKNVFVFLAVERRKFEVSNMYIKVSPYLFKRSVLVANAIELYSAIIDDKRTTILLFLI